MIHIINTSTGRIYVDTDKKLEFLTVGDYGRENNIKADFLGLTKKINGVPHKEVSLADKWVITISTQKGCAMNCRFCDCPEISFSGNASWRDLTNQILTILRDFAPSTPRTKRLNIHYARMGEPTFNAAVLDFTKYSLRGIVGEFVKADTVHPVISTMMPKGNKNLMGFLQSWCNIKNIDYEGEAGLQLSINSTNEAQREWLFRGKSLPLSRISEMAEALPIPRGRKYTLNFPVTDTTILDPKELSRLFSKDKFIVKITPIHETREAAYNGIQTIEGYNSYSVYEKFEEPLLREGWEVIVFIPSKEEDRDRITCGNALLATFAAKERNPKVSLDKFFSPNHTNLP